MFKRFMASKPDTMLQAISANNVSKKTWSDSKKSLSKYIQFQLFITSLQGEFRKELMKSTYINFRAAYEATMDLEVI